jgi:hypothetical protein
MPIPILSGRTITPTRNQQQRNNIECDKSAKPKRKYIIHNINKDIPKNKR